MSHTEEPRPRSPAQKWIPYNPSIIQREQLIVPTDWPRRDFAEVLYRRRSRVAGLVSWNRVIELLWHAVGMKAQAQSGRADIPIEWRNSPSAGGLHPIDIICISQSPDDGIRLYDPAQHQFAYLAADSDYIIELLRNVLIELVGTSTGITLFFVADSSKVEAAYESGASLLWRSAGALISSVCVCAEWLELCACPLGFHGDELLKQLPFPEDRFTAVGGVLISSEIV